MPLRFALKLVCIVTSSGRMLVPGLYAQQSNTDSLERLLTTLPQDTVRVQVWNDLAYACQTPGDFLRYMRLKRAARLLKMQSGKVSEIAYQAGFNNLSYFALFSCSKALPTHV